MENVQDVAAEATEKTEPVAPEATEKTEDTVTLSKAEAESLFKAAEDATALAAKKTEDAENYKRGMMKYKSKLKDSGIEDEDEQPATTKEEIAEIVRQTIRESLPEFVNKTKTENDPLDLANKKIAEMRNVIANRKGGMPSSAGSNLDKPDIANDNYWSPQQESDLKKRGLDPKKVWANLPREGQTSGMK
jgi:hypothetical protein